VTSYTPSAQSYFAPGVYNLPITVRDWSNNGSVCTSVVTVLPSGPAPRPEAGEAFKVSLYPNPTSGEVRAEFSLPEAQDFLLRVCNLSGMVVLTQKVTGAAGENIATVQMGGLQPGIYLLELRSEDLFARKRVLLQR